MTIDLDIYEIKALIATGTFGLDLVKNLSPETKAANQRLESAIKKLQEVDDDFTDHIN